MPKFFIIGIVIVSISFIAYFFYSGKNTENIDQKKEEAVVEENVTVAEEKITAAEESEEKKDKNSATEAFTIPSFDIIRVEQDGSAVFAGKGTPNKRLEIYHNDQPIGGALIQPDKSWVMIPENLLTARHYCVTFEI